METGLDLKLFGFYIDDDKLQSSNSLKLFGVEIDPNDTRPRLLAPEPENHPLTDRDFLVGIGADSTSVQLIITRTLCPTDMSTGHARLSMPRNQRRQGFLRPEEEASIETGYKQGNRDLRHKLVVMVVDPSRRFYKMHLTKWNFNPEKKTSWWYALTNGWNTLAADNHLVAGDTVQVWSFRFLANGRLGFLIRKI